MRPGQARTSSSAFVSHGAASAAPRSATEDKRQREKGREREREKGGRGGGGGGGALHSIMGS